MAELAKWGGIIFKVNSNQVFSFRKMKRSYSARWASHSIVGDKPKMEFQGPGMQELTIDVVLDAELGVKPLAMLNKFRAAAENGTVAYFYVGGKKVSPNKFYISGGSETWDRIWNQGELVKATASLTFGEYR